MKNGMKRDDGFTLVEMAIILVIVGILLTAGAGMIGTLTKRSMTNETKETLSAATDSVIGYGASNERIPTVVEFPGVARKSTDAWTKSIYYIPDSDLASSSSGGICARRSTGLTVRVCPDAACASPTSTVANVAFACVSGGQNSNIQTRSVAGTISVYEPDIPGIDDYPFDMHRAESYDDLVRWVTLYELRTKAGCQDPQLRILNTVLPNGTNGAAYSVEVYPDGGVPFSGGGGSYRWCVQTPSGTLPGWINLTPHSTPVNADCSSIAEGSWRRSDTLVISGTAQTGATNLTIFVRDNNDTSGSNDNTGSRAYVLTAM